MQGLLFLVVLVAVNICARSINAVIEQ